jgi:hypothetical protein
MRFLPAVYGRHVIEVEHSDQAATAFTTACLQRRTLISIVRRDRDLVAAGQPRHVERGGGAADCGTLSTQRSTITSAVFASLGNQTACVMKAGPGAVNSS